MTDLDSWLKQATRCLARESAARARTELRQHYESSRESAIVSGSNADAAGRIALAALGDARTVNSQYRQVLLTSVEAKLLGDGNWEARVVCSRPWLKLLMSAIPMISLICCAVFLLKGDTVSARLFLAAALGTGMVLAAPFLPIYTPSRSRVFRRVKWVSIALAFALAFGPDFLKFSWLLSSCLWPMVWVEWTRVSIRRKLKVADWPKQLYL